MGPRTESSRLAGATAQAEPRTSRPAKSEKGEIWWSNGIFFISLHLFAFYGAYRLSPASQLDYRTLILCIISWQLASFGITIGYHRLWSHKAFSARTPLRLVLAWMGSMGFQGSIKWWVLRHRLHHRFTDSPVHDPYAATKGLFFAHCGWIFRKPIYPRMKLIERNDLESDPGLKNKVVQFQHKYYVPIALFSGLILPALIGHFGWNDGLGGLVWGGAVARLLIWHTTFCINSLAHWTGLQPYTEEVTAKGNYLLAILTSGEGNHNFHHAFPKDFRNGPHPADWDPSKWIIWVLHHFTPFVPSIARTPPSAISSARARVHLAEAERLQASIPSRERVRDKADLPVWSRVEVQRRHGEWVDDESEEGKLKGGRRRRVLVLLEGCIVDVGGYLEDHPGGEQLLLDYAVLPLPESADRDDAFSSKIAVSAIEQIVEHRSSLPIRRPVHSRTLTSSSSHPSSPDLSDMSPPMSSASSPASSISSDQEDEGADMKKGTSSVELKDATRAFFGGMNNHSGAAKEWMRCLRVARLGDDER